MFLEGEIDWILVLGVLAGVMTVVAVFSTWFALTHRKRVVNTTGELDVVQKVAQSADKRLFETLNAIPVALVETDSQGKFVFANRAAHQLLGRRDAELLGLRFHSATWGITFPDGRTVPPDMLPSARALRGQTVRGFQHILANPATRRKMLVSVTAMPIENEYGQIIGSTAAIVETEGLTTPEAAMPEPVPVDPGAEMMRRVFESASSALVVVSTHGIVREANATAVEASGRSDVIDGDFADLFLPLDQRVEARQALRAGLSAPAGAAEPIFARVEGGEFVWRILPLHDASGAVDALLLAGGFVPAAVEESPVAEAPVVESPVVEPPVVEPLVVDTPAEPDPELLALRAERDAAVAQAQAALQQAHAARAEAETALAEADRLDRRATAEDEASRRLEGIGRLTGGVAQDFNALLTVMTSALDMMLKQADDPTRVRRLGQAALAAGQRGEALTRRLAAFTEGEEAHQQTLDAGVLLRAMEGRLRALAGSGVDLMIEGPSHPAPVRLDPVAFEGAVRALVINALDAVGPSGSIAVRLEATPEGARLSVRDTGPGMDIDTRTRASEPFFTTKTGAAGLGLAQAQAFARQSGGALTIASAPGEGSEVSVTLPAQAA